MVGDINLKAYDRLTIDYNFAGYPSCFLDGGADVEVGGTPLESVFRSKIETAGQRAVSPIDMLVKLRWVDSAVIEISVAAGNNTEANTPPAKPSQSSGTSQGASGVSYQFTSQAADIEDNELYYQFFWGDGDSTGWIGPYNSGTPVTAEHSWNSDGAYLVTVQAKDSWEYLSQESTPFEVSIGCCQGIRGNVDSDPSDEIDISDLVYFVSYSFGNPGGPPPACLEEADIDNSGSLDISDIVALVTYMFSSGQAPLNCS